MTDIEREYWRKAGEGVEITDYPEIDDEVNFPGEIFVASAVCSKECGHREFIVDGSTQICHYCSKVMFRTVVGKYRRGSDDPVEEA